MALIVSICPNVLSLPWLLSSLMDPLHSSVSIPERSPANSSSGLLRFPLPCLPSSSSSAPPRYSLVELPFRCSCVFPKNRFNVSPNFLWNVLRSNTCLNTFLKSSMRRFVRKYLFLSASCSRARNIFYFKSSLNLFSNFHVVSLIFSFVFCWSTRGASALPKRRYSMNVLTRFMISVEVRLSAGVNICCTWGVSLVVFLKLSNSFAPAAAVGIVCSGCSTFCLDVFWCGGCGGGGGGMSGG